VPDADGWQRVLSKDEGRQPPRNKPDCAPVNFRLPAELDGRCLNCLSYKHRVATCHLPRRCIRCHGLRHLAKDCKRPRNGNTAREGGPAAGRFVRARRGEAKTPRGVRQRLAGRHPQMWRRAEAALQAIQ
jgi:hypothetical protein